MTVSLAQIARSGNNVTLRVYWSVTLSSATNNGASTSNNRTLYIKRSSDGATLGSALIKNATTWSAGQTYAGSFDITFSVGTMNAGSMNVYIQTSDGGTQSCIWTDRAYCTDFSFSWTKYWTACGAASNLRFSVNPFETSVTLQWNAGADGQNNAITGYELYWRLNSGADTKVTLGKVTSYNLGTSGFARGALLDFYVRSISPENAVNSARTAQARKNRVPNTPTSPSVPKTSYIPGETIVVTFSNNGDPDGNLAGFEAATDVSESIVGFVASAAATSVSINTTGWEQGIQRRFRVRGYDAFGVRGAWSAYTALVTLNTAPLAPEISYPAAGSTVYRKRPRILLKAAATNDGPKHILCVNDGSEKTTALNGTVYSCGTNDNLASAQQVVYQPPADLASGSNSISARMYDSFLYSSVVSRSFTVVAFAPADLELTVPGMKIKAAQITELQTAIGHLRTAYGLSAVSWTACAAGVTFISAANDLIGQLQTALQAVIDRINGWDAATATFDVSVTWISPAATGGGVDRVKLRQAIEQLRSTITQI
jgi:hypothetical protein